MGQQLTMTPQLQQAIRLLQLSTLDLQQEIQEALESNPMLERQEEGDDFDNADERRAELRNGDSNLYESTHTKRFREQKLLHAFRQKHDSNQEADQSIGRRTATVAREPCQ